MQHKSAYSTPTNAAEKENCQVQKVQPLKDASGNESKMKIQMKMLSDLLHKLAASKGNTSSTGASGLQSLASNQFLLKPKSFLGPKKGKVALLGKRASF